MCRLVSGTKSSVSATGFIGFKRGSALCRRRTSRVPWRISGCWGFDVDLDRKHFYLAHETVVRREKGSAMGPISFAIFAFFSKISSRAPDYFKIPHDGVIEVGFRIEI